jgi:hypothetical protein
MSPQVATEDLIDAHDVAELLGLSMSQTVATYQRRYPEYAQPIVDLGRGRPKLWLRPDVNAWAESLWESGRTRPARRVCR